MIHDPANAAAAAARIWLPADAEQNPVPAILEYLPYRKRDGRMLFLLNQPMMAIA
jgi:predicted acyl esterase